MQFLLTLAYLFFTGASPGRVLELVYRNLNKPGDKWINPGF